MRLPTIQKHRWLTTISQRYAGENLRACNTIYIYIITVCYWRTCVFYLVFRINWRNNLFSKRLQKTSHPLLLNIRDYTSKIRIIFKRTTLVPMTIFSNKKTKDKARLIFTMKRRLRWRCTRLDNNNPTALDVMPSLIKIFLQSGWQPARHFEDFHSFCLALRWRDSPPSTGVAYTLPNRVQCRQPIRVVRNPGKESSVFTLRRIKLQWLKIDRVYFVVFRQYSRHGQRQCTYFYITHVLGSHVFGTYTFTMVSWLQLWIRWYFNSVFRL